MMNVMNRDAAWRSFKGVKWTDDVNVRDFIQNNYTPYDGDESFLVGPTEATDKLWGKVQELPGDRPAVRNFRARQPDESRPALVPDRRAVRRVHDVLHVRSRKLFAFPERQPPAFYPLHDAEFRTRTRRRLSGASDRQNLLNERVMRKTEKHTATIPALRSRPARIGIHPQNV